MPAGFPRNLAGFSYPEVALNRGGRYGRGVRTFLEITDVAFGGKAVGRLDDGRVCFVPDALPGERVEVQIVRQTKRFVEATLVRVLEASPHRVKPPCPYYGVCGGCVYQHVSYETQVGLKKNQVAQVLQRLGGVKNPLVREAIPSPLPYGYRNRITVHRRAGRIGFHRRNGRGLVDIEACLLASDAVNALLAGLRREPFREGARTLREHRERQGFHQTNDAVAKQLLEVVEEACEGGEILVDAFCGDGFFARHLAGKFRRVIGIEWNPRSIEQARRLAPENVAFVEGDVTEQLAAVLESLSGKGTVILDPPAQGVDARVIDILRTSEVANIVYVSCNPATLARDIKLLGFDLAAVTPLDMFPQTAEVEVVAVLRRSA